MGHLARLLTTVAALALALALAACAAPADRRTPSASGNTVPAAAPTSGAARLGPDGRPFVVTPVAAFDEAWALEFLPGTPWLALTQRPGTLVLFDPATATRLQVDGVPRVVDAGQGGLGDLVAGPTFATDQTVYLSWVEAGQGGTGAAVGRARLVVEQDAARLDGLEVIWRQAPKTSGAGHFAHRLAFSPDGQYLFVSSGDRQKMQPAQDLGVTLGKILRLTPSGEPAPGNPFADRGGATAQVWSYGHRNPLGLAFDEAGNLWSTEMGPQGGDEVNLILPGRNYGWPQASNGSHYGGGAIPDHTTGDGFEGPLVWWTPSVSPGSLLVYGGDRFPAWRGDALVGALSGQALIRVDLAGTTASPAERWDMGARVRDVEEGPDGSVWVVEDGPGGRLLRLDPPA